MNSRRRPLAALTLAALLALPLSGCGAEEEPAGTPAPTWSDLEEERVAEEDAARLEAAASAIRKLGTQLLTELQTAIAREGHAAAISVCKEKAPAIAARVSEESGLRIGRTSFRRRNPDNAPPRWALDLVEAEVATPRYRRLEDGALGVLQPIRMMPLCSACHGGEDEILPEVRERIDVEYPEDRARGFGVGDLRGWFWVEAP